MGTELRYPKITARTEREQLEQMKSYLHQLVDQLQTSLHGVDAASASYQQAVKGKTQGSGEKPDPAATFASIKALIIKSADIVEAYSQEITKKLSSKFVAESDFGSFAEWAEQQLKLSSTAIEQNYTNMQALVTDIEADLDFYIAEVNAHIRSGLLYYDSKGVPVYGLEIGQRTKLDGQEVFNKYARFTADRLSFYDQNGTEVAYVSDQKLYIRTVEITTSFQLGGYIDIVQPNGRVITKWVGTGGGG